MYKTTEHLENIMPATWILIQYIAFDVLIQYMFILDSSFKSYKHSTIIQLSPTSHPTAATDLGF